MRLNKKTETMTALSTKEKAKKAARNTRAFAMAVSTFVGTSAIAATAAFADGEDDKAIGQIVKIMDRVGKACGAGLMIFGVYELVMAFLQSQAEAKTKGILMVVCGAILMTVTAIASELGVGGSTGSGE